MDTDTTDTTLPGEAQNLNGTPSRVGASPGSRGKWEKFRDGVYGVWIVATVLVFITAQIDERRAVRAGSTHDSWHILS